MTSKGYRNILKSITIALSVVVLFSCKNDLNVVKSFANDENTPLESSYDVSTVMTDSGNVKVRMETPQIDHYIQEEKDFMELPKGMHLYFYDSLGNVNSELTSLYAINHINEMKMEAKHNVVAYNRKNEKLETEHLIWDQNEHIIYTEEKVVITTEGEMITGIGMTADETFDNWEIHTVTGSFFVDDPDAEDTEAE